MRLLALDIGKRRTGIAYGDSTLNIIIALDTLKHSSDNILIKKVGEITKQRKIESLIIGLPLLPDGTDGEQSQWTKAVVQKLKASLMLPVTFIDERYSSHIDEESRESDRDARAACALLGIAIDRMSK